MDLYSALAKYAEAWTNFSVYLILFSVYLIIMHFDVINLTV